MSKAGSAATGAPAPDLTVRAAGAPGWLRIPLLPTEAEADNGFVAATVTAIDLRHANGQTLDARRVSIGPGRGVDRLLRLQLQRDAPPGRYSGAIEVAGVTRPIEIDVAEQVALAIKPSQLVIDRSAAAPPTPLAVFENRGNVPLTIDLTGEYPLGEEIQLGAAHALVTASQESTGLADLFAAVLAPRPGPVLQAAGSVLVTMPDGPLNLEPGAVGTAAFDLVLPADLSPVRRYRCSIPVYTAQLDIVVVTAAKSTTL